MRGKRGSHVGMILSFAIFITFIVFLYSVLNPAIKAGEDKTATMEYIESQILKNVSENLTSASIGWAEEDEPGDNCIRLVGILLFMEVIPPYKAIIKNENNIVQNEIYLMAPTSPDIQLDRENPSERFFRVYSSPKFPEVPVSIIPCTEFNGYTIGSVTSGKYVFESEMYRFIDYYNYNYEGLKTELKVPPGSEFGLIFVQHNKTEINIGQPGKSATVHVKELPVQYVDNDANILSGFINVKVW